MDTIVYVDGFNLYYRILKKSPQYKWLNLLELAKQVLSPSNNIVKVRYFTARVSGKLDPTSPAHQNDYLSALSSIPEIEVHYGNFNVTKTWAGLVMPDLDPAKPNAKPPFMPWPNVVRVWKTEEKGSDVNLGAHLLNDAFKNSFKVAAVITNDTDLVEPIKIATQEHGRTVGLITPVPQPAATLKKYSSFCHHIREQHLKASQFPEQVRAKSGSLVIRPSDWV